MDFALTGNESQIETISWVIHSDMNIAEQIQKLRARFEDVLEGETAHLITRVTTQTTQASYLTKAGNNEQHINDVMDWVSELYARCFDGTGKVGFPLSFQFLNFVSYTPLKGVK